MFNKNINESNRQAWLKKILANLAPGSKILDAGAGELRNQQLCFHLDYTSQDACQYDGRGDGAGLQTKKWDTSKIDIVCDIASIPRPNSCFDVILCSEVLEHLPDPVAAIAEFSRLLKPNGVLILTAPFASMVHFAPFFYSTGFSRYWYEYHLPRCGFQISELVENGGWGDLLAQEVSRIGSVYRLNGSFFWPLAYFVSLSFILFIRCTNNSKSHDIGTFGYMCIAVRK